MNFFLIMAYLFFIGSVIGWVIELVFRNLVHKSKTWINPGFCTGPYLPIYGFGLCTLYLLASLEELHLVADPVWNKVVLAFEEIKAHLRDKRLEARHKYFFFAPFRTERPLREHLKELVAALDEQRKERKK